MAISSGQGPFQITDITNQNIASIDINGAMSVTDNLNRQIQEMMLLIQQNQLLTLQLSKEKTSHYFTQELR